MSPAKATKIGVYGGTFDPIHRGHLDVARAARAALGLDRVVLMPAAVPPHRASPRASAAHRFAMTAIAILGEDGLDVSDLEMQSPAPSYTSSTLDRLAARGFDTTSLCLIAGADAFADIASWKDYPALLDRCQFVVVSRPERPAPALRAALPALAARMIDVGPGSHAVRASSSSPSIFLVDAPTAPVSSTAVRDAVREGRDIVPLVGAGVAAHIAAHRLYRVAEPQEAHGEI